MEKNLVVLALSIHSNNKIGVENMDYVNKCANDTGNLIVKKSHELVNSRYTLPIYAQKLICYCATKIEPGDTDFKSIEITAKELQAITKVQNPYEELKYIANQIFEGEIYTNFLDGKFVERKRWVTTLKYYDGEGRVIFEFHPDVKPWLLHIKDRALKYELKILECFQFKYSLRFYELLLDNRVLVNNNEYTVDFELVYLRKMLVIDDKYPRFADLKRYVIEPVVDELKKTNLIDLRYNLIKSGRAVSRIQFFFKFNSADEK